MERTSAISSTTTDTSQRDAAVVTGIAMIVMTVFAVIATDFVLGNLVVPGDAAATTSNISISQSLFRFGTFSLIIILVTDVLVAWGLFIFFKPVNPGISLLCAWFRLAYVMVLATAIGELVYAQQLISDKSYLSSIALTQLQTHVMLSINVFNDTWSLGLSVFGIHILLLAYLAKRYRVVPRIFPILLFIAGIGYIVTNISNLMIPSYGDYKTLILSIFFIPMVVGEAGLGLWLLARGGKT